MNLNGRILKATAIDNWPYHEVKTLKNGTLISTSGIDVQIISILKSKLNFS